MTSNLSVLNCTSLLIIDNLLYHVCDHFDFSLAIPIHRLNPSPPLSMSVTWKLHWSCFCLGSTLSMPVFRLNPSGNSSVQVESTLIMPMLNTGILHLAYVHSMLNPPWSYLCPRSRLLLPWSCLFPFWSQVDYAYVQDHQLAPPSWCLSVHAKHTLFRLNPLLLASVAGQPVVRRQWPTRSSRSWVFPGSHYSPWTASTRYGSTWPLTLLWAERLPGSHCSP